MDKTYKCKICNYSTSDKSNYSRHTKSIRHMKKVSEINDSKNDNTLAPQLHLNNPQPHLNTPHYKDHNKSTMDKETKIKSKYECKYCETAFKRLDNLNRHSKVCSERVVYELKRKLEDKDKELDLAMRLKDDKIELLESDLIYYKNLIKTAGVGSGAKITTNVQSLIVNKHDDAPAIEYAKPNLLKFNSKDAYENSLFLVNRYKDNTFTMFVGKCIVAACKKEDPDEQSVWATDANRLTMFIKKMMNDESKWISDKKGVQTTKYLINPILQRIKEMLIDYNKHLYSQVGKLSQHEVDYYNDIMINCRELVHFIEHEKLADEILKYMAPRLTYEIK